MKLAILTSNHLRHNYFVNTIAREHSVALAVRETKRDVIQTSKMDDTSIMAIHLAQREEKEKEYFGAHPQAEVSTLDIAPGEINQQSVFEAVASHTPEAVLLFGTSIVKDPLLSHFPGRVINMHLGLSPYYRGTATNFWPLVNGEPECLGVTIHLATLKVDGGPIIHQVRPMPTRTDRAHDLGCKAILEGTRGILDVLEYLEDHGKLPETPQDFSHSLLYKRKDFSGESVKKLWENFEQGMIEEYVDHFSVRVQSKPIVTLHPCNS